MTQVEFGIVGKNVVESELKLQIFVQFLICYNFWVKFLTLLQIFFYKMAVIQYFCLLFSHYSQFLHTPIILKIIPA